MLLRKPLTVVLAAVALAACGPGGEALVMSQDFVDDSYSEVDDLDTTQDALVAGVLDPEELIFLSALNSYRAGKGLPKLKVSIALTKASQSHSADLAATGTFSHNSSDGTSFADRVKRFYGCNCYLGENIAMGTQLGGQKAFDMWKASPGHDANMLGTNYRVVGIARVANASGAYYWTTDFGSEVDAVFSAGFGSIAANGGFESDAFTRGVAFSAVRTLNRWHTQSSTGGSANRTTAARQAGSWGLRQVDPDPGNTAVTQVVKAAAGVNYRASAMARKNSGATSQILYLDFLDASFARIRAVTASGGTSTTFAQVKAEEVAPAGTRYVRVILWGSGSAGHRSTFDWDQVRVEAW